ncbi:MAG: hypothetical protein HOU01_21955, partial [Streptomycetaceae bacterium]|nr:hypothetical protein [Streptomycetaceae bacterium]
MSDGEGVVDGLLDVSLGGLVGGMTGAMDLIGDAGRTVTHVATTGVQVAAGLVKAAWTAPKRVGLKPVPTLLAGAAGALAAGVATGTAGPAAGA